MKNKVEASIKRRLAEEIGLRSTLQYLKGVSVDKYLETTISVLYLYTRPKHGTKKTSIYLTEVISAIGHSVRSSLGLKRDSAVAARTGAFLLYTFEELGYLSVILGAGLNGHSQYVVQVLNDDAIVKLWSEVSLEKLEKLPSLTPYAPWSSSKHATGATMVKTGNKDVLVSLTPETHPIVFAVLNKAQTVGWMINRSVYEIYTWALRNKTDAFAEIWELANAEARATKIREAKAIGGMAKRFLNSTFYHLYYYDFRGRKYPTTAYLHEQGSDLARGLLIRASKKQIGTEGFFWLMVSIASNWAGNSGRDDGAKTDKIPLRERYLWALDNEEILLSYAEKPKVNQGWMKADKPWQFLAACNELMKLRIWQASYGEFENYKFESNLEAYIDGSNNGCQHLSALTKDEITAPHVNLVPAALPGDLYRYVADHVWKHIESLVAEMPQELIDDCESFIDTLIEIKKKISETEPKSEQRIELYSKIREYKSSNAEVAELAAPVFWLRIRDSRQKRKVVKRNVMSLPYGSTAYGLSEQQISDAQKHGIDLLYHLEHRWGAFMGREVYEDCKISLKRPMQLLKIFEKAGQAAELRGEFLSWTVPITNFPVVQNYTEGTVKKLYVTYGPKAGAKTSTGYSLNTLQLNVCFIEDQKPSKGKQSQGASPNAIHSLDAAHLALTVYHADFPITTIHDSFGCLLADMPKLFKLVRETFVMLYKADPLTSLMKDINGDLSSIRLGTLDVSLVLDSEYAFA